MKDITARGWAILVACAFCPGVTFGFLITGFPFWVNPWLEEFHVARSTVMTAFTAGGLVLSLATPLVGRALDAISVRASILAGALLMAAGMALVAAAQAWWQVLLLFATIVPLGATFAGALPAQTLATRMYPRHAGLVNGVIILGLASGGVLMAGFAPVLIAELGWRAAFLIGAGVLVAVIAPIAWLAFDQPEGRPAKAAPGPAGAPASEGFGALRAPIFWILVAAVLPIMLALAAVPPNLADIAKDFGLGAGAAAALVAAMSLSSAAGSLAGGWLADRLEHWLVYAGLAAMVVAALLGLTLSPDMALATAVMVAFGLAGGALMPLVAAIIARRFGPEAFARVLGLLNPFFIPATFFPIVVAWIRDTSGAYRPAFILFAALIAAGAFVTPLLREPRPAPAPAE